MAYDEKIAPAESPEEVSVNEVSQVGDEVIVNEGSQEGQAKSARRDFEPEQIEDIEILTGPAGQNVQVKHPNRNLNKPDIDKPAY